MVAFSVPALAGVLGVLLLSEPLSLRLTLAWAIILTGIGLAIWSHLRQRGQHSVHVRLVSAQKGPARGIPLTLTRRTRWGGRR
jgi:drug/metabolite transporter (DMT)-like permease